MRSKGLILALTALQTLAAGCGGTESVASKSHRAFREAQARGESFGGEGHAHDHGAAAATGKAGGEEPRGAVEPEEGARPAEHREHHHEGIPHGASQGAREGGDENHSRHRIAPRGPAEAVPPEHHPHAAAPGGAPSGRLEEPAVAVAAAPVSPGAPAATLAPDSFDAPAPTSTRESQRAVALARAMGGGTGHGGHGGHGDPGAYRQLDAGRKPEAIRVYTCPMHTEVRSEKPGNCPLCGMELVQVEE